MNSQAPSNEEILVAAEGRQALIRVIGRGSFKISAPLKQFARAVIDQGARHLVFDMQHCVGMDSTFMGVLAGLSFQLQKFEKGAGITLIELTPRTQGLLATLGLDRAVKVYATGASPAELTDLFKSMDALQALPEDDGDRRHTAEMMLEAHENLVQLTEENLPRFKDVLTFLQEDVNKEKQESDGEPLKRHDCCHQP